MPSRGSVGGPFHTWLDQLLTLTLSLGGVVGVGEERLQGSWELGPQDSVPIILYHPGQRLRLRTVSWARLQVWLLPSHPHTCWTALQCDLGGSYRGIRQGEGMGRVCQGFR